MSQGVTTAPFLTVENLTLHYGRAQAIFGVDLSVMKGETVALVGANGAGKTSLLKAILGLLPASGGRITFDGADITRWSPVKRVRAGIAISPEGRQVFPGLTVTENLELGALALKIGAVETNRRMEEIFERFPRLKERLTQTAGTLSGGEQQMVAIGRALMAAPKLLLLDEPSLGLAPLVADEIFDSLHRLTRSGMTILLIEQNAARALSGSARAYLFANGRVSGEGESDKLLLDPELRRAFLGAASEQRPESSRLGATGLTNVHGERALKSFLPEFNSSEELKEIQTAGLKWTVRHALDGSPFYREKLTKAGVGPDSVNSLADLVKLPFTTADDLKEGYPYPLLSVPLKKVRRVHASSGTTGRKKVLAYTQKDLDDWTHFFARALEMAGVTPLDRVQIAVGFGLWSAGAGFQAACEKVGAMALPMGQGNLDLQCEFLVDLKPTVFCGTASMALLLAEETHRRGLSDKLSIKKVIYGSERSSDAMRARISDYFGGAELFDMPGLTELYGPGVGIECPHHGSIHYFGDYYILEIVDPETLKPVPDGEWGEMVVTTLAKEAAPLIRYRTRDVTRIIPGVCSCGSPLPMHSRILGRTDQMFKFHGINVYPSTLDDILSKIPGLGSEYRVRLSRNQSGRDNMTLTVELARGVEKGRAPDVRAELMHRLKSLLFITADIELAEYGSLPRTEGVSSRIFDDRLSD